MSSTEANTDQSNLFSSIGALVGMVAGGPGGAAIGGGLGSLLGGGSFQDAIGAGIGSFSQGSFGPAGLALNALNAFSGGDSGGTTSQGGNIMGLLSGQQSGFQGGPTGAIRGILQAIGVEDAQGRTDPILGGLLQQMLYEQRAPRFDKVMSGTELAQYDKGERRPDYTGTKAPGTPTVRYAATGGMIYGPGTGRSDSIPAQIYQNGGPVQEARLSDGEFVMTADAVRGAGGGNRDAGAARMYQMMNQLERVA